MYWLRAYALVGGHVDDVQLLGREHLVERVVGLDVVISGSLIGLLLNRVADGHDFDAVEAGERG